MIRFNKGENRINQNTTWKIKHFKTITSKGNVKNDTIDYNYKTIK